MKYNDNLTDFPEFLTPCELFIPWRGYKHGLIVGQAPDNKFIIELDNGKQISVYRDEFRMN